ncbi:MAG: YigZ family protein [Flavobacteriales bacterium]
MASVITDPHTYRTLAGTGKGLYREKASKFLSIAFPIADETDFKVRLTGVAKEHHDARHHCYAYVLGADGSVHRNSDAGEPSGTAGKPILRHLQGRSLTFSAVIVVRWFGGTLLGKGGLVQAYGEAARCAIDAAGITDHLVTVQREVVCGYAQVEQVKASVANAKGEVMFAEYGDPCTLQVALPIARIKRLEEQWRRADILCTVPSDQPK